MDFQFTAEQDEAAELAARILADQATPARMSEVEASPERDDRFDRALWQQLADTGLLSLHLPEEHGGAGLGFLELCRVLVEVGRRVAPVPLVTHGPAGLALARRGTAAQQQAWLPAAARGERLLAVALDGPTDPAPATPVVTADRHEDGYVLTGVLSAVPAGTTADLLLVPARTDAGPAVFLVETTCAGLTLTPQHTTDGDETALVELAHVTLPAEALLGTPGDDTAALLHDLAVTAVCAQQCGVTAGALRLTAAYATEREQFDRPVGTFQAVSQRLADGYIDTLGQDLTLWQAAWRLHEGLPVTTEVATAKLWAADAGHRLAHTTVHVHGGVGVDVDGEAHRYFTAAKRLEHTHGGATHHARAVGRSLAATEPEQP